MTQLEINQATQRRRRQETGRLLEIEGDCPDHRLVPDTASQACPLCGEAVHDDEPGAARH